ncbi:hypothetical protein IV38_GL000957 [Lactobacillus selangorensis]|uniref:DUF3100 domain-containing protein n=1 Tax=Lactobacillus selangorensis TaxID=81857 RepID=A0A0R2FJM5_9LACO|nr:DUF3100 domain-containing protein [Lactobacillus selangorensis]KRN28752.1 hypothetical protein IV38_GL000957 [Lactobacillus selangorensis]KRN32838.1 hypothetical protein IV40_GL000896 [Lactobacillus selangorensis]
MSKTKQYTFHSLRERIRSEKKIYLMGLLFVIIASSIGELHFKIGAGVFILFPIFYAIIFGVVSGPQALKFFNNKEVKLASKLVVVGICPFIVKLGITAGANLNTILSAGPALLFHGLGNLLGIFLALPVAMLLGMRRDAVGASSSLNREYQVAIINNIYGADSEEASGSMAIYIVGGMIGTLYFGLMASIFAGTGLFAPKALGMASGVGAGIFMASASASLAEIFPHQAATITAMASASNTVISITGIYITMFLAVPLTDFLYKKLLPLFTPKTAKAGEETK